MSRIEIALHQHHATQQQAEATRLMSTRSDAYPVSGGSSRDDSQDRTVETPFAKVNSVAEGSPAFTAGLKAGDSIRSFGEVNWMNHENLKKVAEVVQRNEGVSRPWYPTTRAELIVLAFDCSESDEKVRWRNAATRAQATAGASSELGRSRYARLPPRACLSCW